MLCTITLLLTKKTSLSPRVLIKGSLTHFPLKKSFYHLIFNVFNLFNSVVEIERIFFFISQS